MLFSFSGTTSALVTLELFMEWSVAALLLFSIAACFGRLNKYFELTSHFRVQYLLGAAVSLPVCLAFAKWWCVAGAVLSATVNLSAIVPLYGKEKALPCDGTRQPRLKLTLVNIYRGNRAHEAFLRYIEVHPPDVIVVQEVTDNWACAIQSLRERCPFHEVLPREDGSGIALYSRFPFERLPLALPEGDARPGILVRLDIEGVTVSLLSIHPRAPIRRGHFELRNAVMAAAATCLQHLPGPKICIGDLNTSMWSPFYQDFVKRTKLVSVREGFGILASWPTFMVLRGLMIPIDHCLVSSDIRVVAAEIAGRVGSDHFPLRVELEFSPHSYPGP